MSTIIDQLRISDDGKKLYLDAHVNKASAFDDVYLSKVTICTEDQVLETDPCHYGDNYVYQHDFTPSSHSTVVPLDEKVHVLSEQALLNHASNQGCWCIDCNTDVGLTDASVSFIFSGKFSRMSTGYAPCIAVTNGNFDPTLHSLDSDNVLFIVDGHELTGSGHSVWQFNGKGYINNNDRVWLYLYAQFGDGSYEYIRIQDTDDKNFLHFYWQCFAVAHTEDMKEAHLVLTPADFNENFTLSDFSHNMFFVYIETTGTPAEDTPCRLDEATTLGVTFDYGQIFNRVMQYIKTLGNDCMMPQQFINYILNVEALKLSIETEHYVPAINHWNWLMNETNSGSVTPSITKPCGCHG